MATVETGVGAAGAVSMTLDGVEPACRRTAGAVSAQMGNSLWSQRGLTIWITSST